MRAPLTIFGMLILGWLGMGGCYGAVALSILPDRDQVLIRFEDSGAVLVEEARTLTLDKGSNHINFTWLGVEIDRSSIQLLRVEGVAFQVLRVSYPPDQDNSQDWEVAADAAGIARVRISYLLEGISREVFYRAVIADGGDPHLTLRIFQKLDNASGETYDTAALSATFGTLHNSSLATGEIHQQLTAHFADVPFTKRYTYDPLTGDQVTVSYVLINSQAGKLGNGLLPPGKLRLFQQTGQNEAFLGEDMVQPTPSGEKLEVKVGDSRDLVVRRVVLSQHAEVLQRDDQNREALWNHLTDLRYEVENFTSEEKNIELVEHLSGEWDVASPVQILEKRISPEHYELAKGEMNPAGSLERKDAETLIIHLSVPQGRRVVFTCATRNLHCH